MSHGGRQGLDGGGGNRNAGLHISPEGGVVVKVARGRPIGADAEGVADSNHWERISALQEGDEKVSEGLVGVHRLHAAVGDAVEEKSVDEELGPDYLVVEEEALLGGGIDFRPRGPAAPPPDWPAAAVAVVSHQVVEAGFGAGAVVVAAGIGHLPREVSHVRPEVWVDDPEVLVDEEQVLRTNDPVDDAAVDVEEGLVGVGEAGVEDEDVLPRQPVPELRGQGLPAAEPLA